MTPAEFKTLRESLGLTTEWLAQWAGVNDRTVKYWESGSKNTYRAVIPPGVAEGLQAIEAEVEAMAKALADLAEAQGAKTGSTVALLRYKNEEDLLAKNPGWPYPNRTHGVIMSMARSLLAQRGIGSSLVWFEPDRYNDWLAGQNRDDSDSARAAWAALEAQADVARPR